MSYLLLLHIFQTNSVTARQGRIQLATLGGGDFSNIWQSSLITSSLL